MTEQEYQERMRKIENLRLISAKLSSIGTILLVTGICIICGIAALVLL